jgi:hypothetical protein
MNEQDLQALREKEAEAARRVTEQSDRDALHAALSHVQDLYRTAQQWQAKANVLAEQASRARGEFEVAEQAAQRAAAELESLIAGHAEG